MPSFFKNIRRQLSHTNAQDSSVQPGSSNTLKHSPSTVSNASRASKSSTIFGIPGNRHQYSIRVALLDGRVIQLNYTKHDDASHLFNRVCDEEQIGVEKDWFGLRFIDSHGQPHWLDMHKNARSQLKKGLPHSIHFRSSLTDRMNTDAVNESGALKISPSKSSMNSSVSYASMTLPRMSSKRSAVASPSDFDQQYRDTESFTSESNTNFSLNNSHSSFSSPGAGAIDNVSELQFRFKFYPQNPTLALQEESTRYALVKQLRSDFRQGKLTSSVSDESKLIACLLQADLGNLADQVKLLPTGNFKPGDVGRALSPHATPPLPKITDYPAGDEASSPGGFARSNDTALASSSSSVEGHSLTTSLSPIPDVYREMNHFGNTGEEKILNEWKALANATPAECDEILLNVAAKLESYGIADMTPVHDMQTDRDGAMLGCNYAGILVRNATRRVNAFAWQKVQKVNLDGKLIVVYVLDSDVSAIGGGAAKSINVGGASNGGVVPKSPVGDGETNKFSYKCRSGSGAKALWKFILETKIFFMAASSKGIAPVRSGRIGPLSFHRRVTLRFSGRTSREAIEHSENVKHKLQAAGGSAASQLPVVQRVPLVDVHALAETRLTIPAVADHHRAMTHVSSSVSGGAGDDGGPEWSEHSKHDLMSQLHDRRLKQSLEIMQEQTQYIADELQEIRSPNTVGSAASTRPTFEGDFLPTPAVDLDGQGFFQQSAAPYHAESYPDEGRFAVGDSMPSREDMLAHSTPRSRGDEVYRNGQWATPTDNRYERDNADFERERVSHSARSDINAVTSRANRLSLKRIEDSKYMRWTVVGSVVCVLFGVLLWLLLSNNDSDEHNERKILVNDKLKHKNEDEESLFNRLADTFSSFLYNGLESVKRYLD